MRDEFATLFIAIVLFTLAIGGCNQLRLSKPPRDDDGQALVDSRQDSSRANQAKPHGAKARRSLSLEGTDNTGVSPSAATPATRALGSRLGAGAGSEPPPAKPRDDGWNTAPASQPPFDGAEGYRWRHLDLEALLALPADERPDLISALEGSNSVVAANGAICLARLGDGRGRQRLVDTVRNSAFRMPLRCAAAEALAELRDPSPAPALRELIDRYGQTNLPSYLPDLHAELLSGLAAHVDAGTDERFAAALKSPSPAARLAAIRGWLRPGEAALPDAAADLRADPDPRVRAAAVVAMAARRHPLALEAAQGALGDFRPEVRLAAVAALGEIGGGEAQKLLEKLEREPEVVRAAAIAALARLGARDPVWAAAESPSWHVRRAVAAALSQWPDAGGVLLARRLLSDPSVEVQKQVLTTLASWPVEKSGPVLLEAMGGSGYLSRKTATAQLAERWLPARDFTADAPADRRAQVLARLLSRWTEEHGIEAPESLRLEGVAKVAGASPRGGPERVEDAARIVRRLQIARPGGGAAADALRELAALGPDLPVVLERLVDEQQLVLAEAVYREVLPRYGGAFAALERLSSSDVHERRRAANRLAELAAREPLNLLALGRLSKLGAAESDSLVWSALFQAVAHDAREPALRLAYAGLGHNSAEVRRLAADYLAAHPSPEHVGMLLPTLADKNYAVVLAAVKAVGRQGVLADPAPLERLLTTNDPPLRLAVAESLIMLGAASGPQTLELLAHDTDIDTRREAAQLMGRLGDDRYVASLIGLLDDTLGVRTAALASLPKVVGRDVADWPDDPPTSTLDRVERWKKWWESRTEAGR